MNFIPGGPWSVTSWLNAWILPDPLGSSGSQEPCTVLYEASSQGRHVAASASGIQLPAASKTPAVKKMPVHPKQKACPKALAKGRFVHETKGKVKEENSSSVAWKKLHRGAKGYEEEKRKTGGTALAPGSWMWPRWSLMTTCSSGFATGSTGQTSSPPHLPYFEDIRNIPNI